jgi:hypothetical protein
VKPIVRLEDMEIRDDRVLFGPQLAVSFQRTLRVPEDSGTYPLPPGLGRFPLYRVEDFGRLPQSMREVGGVFICMYQREAMWVGFEGTWWKPTAVKVGVGGANAVSGHPWDEVPRSHPQDYLVSPNQPWLDGINAGEGFVRQFVAMPLGEGYTVEGQITGAEEHGGIQLVAFDPKPGRFPDQPPPPEARPRPHVQSMPGADARMGLGAGGRIYQRLYPDPYGIETWDTEARTSVWVHILNSEQFQEATGLEPPPTPVDARAYTELGFPWFEVYDEGKGALEAPTGLAGISTVSEIDRRRGVPVDAEEPLQVDPSQVRSARPGPRNRFLEGSDPSEEADRDSPAAPQSD